MSRDLVNRRGNDNRRTCIGEGGLSGRPSSREPLGARENGVTNPSIVSTPPLPYRPGVIPDKPVAPLSSRLSDPGANPGASTIPQSLAVAAAIVYTRYRWPPLISQMEH